MVVPELSLNTNFQIGKKPKSQWSRTGSTGSTITQEPMRSYKTAF